VCLDPKTGAAYDGSLYNAPLALPQTNAQQNSRNYIKLCETLTFATWLLQGENSVCQDALA
jgi:hypothetical protein